MSIEKPLPLMVGNIAYYTLTSYDPVEVTVEIPYVTEEDVALALEMTVRQMGGTMADLDDPAWVAERFDGMTTRAQVTEAVRQQVNIMNTEAAEEQKLGKCIEVLVGRLGQSVPASHVEQARGAVVQRFTQSMQAEGMTPADFMARTGTTTMQLEAMFDEQARQVAEGDAALSAYAHQKKLKVDEHEFPRLLGMPPTDAETLIAQARTAGWLDELREMALRAKAAQIVVAECSCSYVHETPEQARARVAQYRQIEELLGDDEPDDEPPATGRTGFKLV